MGDNNAAIRSKQKIAELVDTAFTLINEGNIKAACQYYLQALEEMGKILVKDSPQAAGEEEKEKENVSNLRIEAAVHHIQKTSSNTFIVKNNAEYAVKDDVDGMRLKMAVVAIKTGLPFL